MAATQRIMGTGNLVRAVPVAAVDREAARQAAVIVPWARPAAVLGFTVKARAALPEQADIQLFPQPAGRVLVDPCSPMAAVLAGMVASFQEVAARCV
jgi:hypothetical protein